jgi:hypothetical protein
MGGKHTDTKNHKKCCNNFKHWQPSQKYFRCLEQCPSRKLGTGAQSKCFDSDAFFNCY